jgi:hypothetical protein
MKQYLFRSPAGFPNKGDWRKMTQTFTSRNMEGLVDTECRNCRCGGATDLRLEVASGQRVLECGTGWLDCGCKIETTRFLWETLLWLALSCDATPNNPLLCICEDIHQVKAHWPVLGEVYFPQNVDFRGRSYPIPCGSQVWPRHSHEAGTTGNCRKHVDKNSESMWEESAKCGSKLENYETIV